MRSRLLGLETEYAIRFSPSPTRERAAARPGNHIIYRALRDAIGERMATLPGERHGVEEERFFTESGAAFCYERLPSASAGGLIEAATPECDGPSQLVCHQRAVDAVLLRAIPSAQERLAAQGYEGELGLIKNCRDAEGHVYGAQENYEARIAEGHALALYRVGLALVAPFVFVHALIVWATILVLFPLVLIGYFIALALAFAVPSWRRAGALDRLCAPDDPALDRVLARMDRVSNLVIGTPAVLLLAGLPLRLFAFRVQRRAMLGFLASRPIVSGAGTVFEEGVYGLSEKGPAIRRVMRVGTSPDDRSIFDTGNLMKDLFAPVRFKWRPFFRLFSARQRMQLGLSDSNVAEVAEYLKVGVTALVLDMAEEGALDDAPCPADPVAALQTIIADPSLKARVPIERGEPMSALELQRAYLARARAFIKRSSTPSMEAHQIVTLWGEVLDALEADPGRLVGVLDWVSKRYLIEACAADERSAVKKKIDIKYHELGGGYFARLADAGIGRPVVTRAEIEAAMLAPPASTPARLRGKLIRDLTGSRVPIEVSWGSVRIGGRLRGEVIDLRKRRDPPEE